MPTVLENLVLSELSFVDKGANPHAKVTIFKRADVPAAQPNPLLPLAKAKPSSGSPARNEREAAARFDDDDEDDKMKTFQDAVNKITARDGVTKTVAMRRAREQFPDLYKSYQREGRVGAKLAGALANQQIAKSAAVVAFEKCVDRVQTRDKCSRLAALTKAAREFPAEREAYAVALA